MKGIEVWKSRVSKESRAEEFPLSFLKITAKIFLIFQY